MTEADLRYIKIYGLKRSGTNFLEQLLRRNVELPHLAPGAPGWISILANYVLYATGWEAHPTLKDWHSWITFSRHLGWKHANVQPARIPDETGHRTLFLSIVKNPYAWVLSAYRSSHCPNRDNLQAFLTSPWPALGRDNHSSPSFASPIDLWNRKSKSYIRLASTDFPTEHLRYEELLEDPAEKIAGIADQYYYPLSVETVRNVDQSTSRNERTFADHREFYLEEKWKSALRPVHVRTVNEQLDQEIMAFHGYSFLQSEDVEARGA